MRWLWLLLKTLAGLVVLIVLLPFAWSLYLSTRPAATTVRPLGTVPIARPFRIGRPFIDYMTLDGDRLYAAFASHNLVGVVDTTTNRNTATIDGLARVHGVAVVPELGLAFTSNGDDNMVGVVDLAHSRLLKEIPGGIDPDAILYDEEEHLIYVADHDGKTGTLLDPAAQKVVATIALGGEPEFCQSDAASGLIYQNLEDTNELVVIDPQQRAVNRRYKLGPGEGPTGLAFDSAHRRLFSATRNKHLIVLNADTGEIIADLPIGSAVDGVAYDPGLRRIYTANALGTITVIQQDTADRYRVLEDAPSHLGGHSVVVNPSTHRIYIAYFGSIAVYEPILR